LESAVFSAKLLKFTLMEVTILFDSIQTAQEVAWMLRAQWDGFNGIQSSTFDQAAIDTATSLCGGHWCWSFESEKLPRIHCKELLQLYQQGTRYFGKMNLVGVDLSYQDLTEIELTGTNLSGADLTAAKLSGASLWDTDLSNCKLANVNLSEAHLINANLIGADLSHANLFKADLDRASLKSANLTHANLSNATLREACLQDANLQGANLTSAHLCRANFEGANLYDAALVKAFLFKANLNRATVNTADLNYGFIKKQGNFKEAVLVDAIMPNGQIYQVKSTLLRDAMLPVVVFWFIVLAGMWVLGENGESPKSQLNTQDKNSRLEQTLILERQIQELKHGPLTP